MSISFRSRNWPTFTQAKVCKIPISIEEKMKRASVVHTWTLRCYTSGGFVINKWAALCPLICIQQIKKVEVVTFTRVDLELGWPCSSRISTSNQHWGLPSNYYEILIQVFRMPVFAEANPPEILRAAQKDDSFIDFIRSEVADIIQRLFGNNFSSGQ